MTANHLLLQAAVYLALSAAVASAYPAALPRRSASPCTYSCPGSDTAGFGLGANSNEGATLFCSYPAFVGEDPNDFYCRYSATDGHLTQDNDAGFCPGTAVANSGCGSRRRMLERAQKVREMEKIKRETVGPETWSPELKARFEEKWLRLKKRKQAVGGRSGISK